MKTSREIMLLVTIGCTCAFSPLLAQAIGVQHISNAHPDDLALSVDAIGTDINAGDRFNGVTVKYNADGTNGGGWFATIGINTGWNAGPADGNGFVPINASEFNAVVPRGMKTDFEQIEETNTDYYVARFREIETVSFRNIFETEETMPDRRLGVVVESLPDEILAMSNARADGRGEPMLAVRLADWLGLVTIVLQDTDRRLTEMQSTLAAVDQRNLELRQENDLLRTRVASLREGTSSVARPAPQQEPLASAGTEAGRFVQLCQFAPRSCGCQPLVRLFGPTVRRNTHTASEW